MKDRTLTYKEAGITKRKSNWSRTTPKNVKFKQNAMMKSIHTFRRQMPSMCCWRSVY